MTAAKRRPGRPIVPGSRQQRRAAADKVLRGLLRTPKTRTGLIAAANNLGKHFVFGWLTEQQRRGDVVALKSSSPVLLYQLASCVVLEQPSQQSDFPSWLEPRSLPTFGERRVYVDGQDVRFKPAEEEDEDE